MVLTLILAFATGLIMKLADQLEDLPRYANKFLMLRIALGILYGSIMFLMIDQNREIASLWLGLCIGLLLIGKLDCVAHCVGFSTFFALSYMYGIAVENHLFFLIFLSMTVIEEKFNDFVDNIDMKNTLLKEIIASRPILEITALLVSIFSGIWSIWLSLLLFDIGYQLSKRIVKE